MSQAAISHEEVHCELSTGMAAINQNGCRLTVAVTFDAGVGADDEAHADDGDDAGDEMHADDGGDADDSGLNLIGLAWLGLYWLWFGFV